MIISGKFIRAVHISIVIEVDTLATIAAYLHGKDDTIGPASNKVIPNTYQGVKGIVQTFEVMKAVYHLR
jgi:hypothetical protein